MKKIILFSVSIIFLVFLSGCTEEKIDNQIGSEDHISLEDERQLLDEKPVDGVYGKFLINDEEIIFPNQSCGISSSDGGPIVEYSLGINFLGNNANVGFSVLDPQNSKDNLLTVGIHTATGEFGNSFSNRLQASHSYSWTGLEATDMDIVIQDISMEEFDFAAKGFINIKRRMDMDDKCGAVCPWQGDYLPPQKIFFKCENGTLF